MELQNELQNGNRRKFFNFNANGKYEWKWPQIACKIEA